MKFAREVFRRVREKVGDEYPVTLRMSGHEHTDGGLQLTDTRFIAQQMEAAGASALHVSAGSPMAPYWHVPPMAIARGCHVELAVEIRKAVKIPVIAVGRINDPVLANEIVAGGKADLVAMGRALIADPYLPVKAKEGGLEDIRKCVACNYCRKRVSQLNRTLRCAVNAETGRERDCRILPGSRSRKVTVIGGGPAGMEAARVLSLRGHRVILYEERKKLGGQVNLAVIPPHKEELHNILDYLVFQTKKLNVEVHLGREATAETVMKERPDAIIVATGALPLLPEIPGLEREKLFTPEEALVEKKSMGEKIIILGGGMVGCEVAEHLGGKGKQVTIVEKLPEIASGMEGHTRRLLLERLKSLSVQMITEAEVASLEGKRAILRKAGRTMELETEGIVVAMGARADRTCREFQSCELPFYAIGDCAEARDIAAAIWEGFRAAMEI